MNIAEGNVAKLSNVSPRITEIRLTPLFVNRMCARLQTEEPRAGSVAGLLYGTQYGPMVVLQAFRSLIETELAEIGAGQKTLDEAVREAVRSTEKEAALEALDLVGWYSLRRRSGLSEQDGKFHERQFPDRSQIALIVRRGEGAFLLFDFYARSEEGVLSAQQHWTGGARFSPAQATTGIVDVQLHDRMERAHATAASAGAAPGPILVQTDEATARRAAAGPAVSSGSGLERVRMRREKGESQFAWRFSALLFTSTAVITFAFLLWPGMSLTRSTDNATLHNGLNLHVETQGDRLLLTWNRNNRVAKGAAKGVLHIDDGNLHRDVQLDGAQVANGAVLYKPNTDDVSFRLQVQGQHGRTLTENLRLLDGTGQSTQALDARRANAPQPTAPLTSESFAPQVKQQSSSSTKNLLAAYRTPALTPSEPRSAPTAEISHPAVPPTGDPPRQPRNATRNPPPLSAPTEIPTLQPKPAPVHASERAALTTASEPGVSGLPVSAEKDLIQKQETPTPIQQEPEPEHVAQTTPARQSALPVTTPQTEGSPAPTPNATAAVFAKNGVSPTPTESGVSPVPFAQRYVPPKPLSQVLPNLSELPRSLLNQASRVIVIVKVDRNGRVTEAQAQPSPDKVGRPIMQAAETAARQWVFQPARLDGKPVASEHSIVFHFAR